jgi:MFS family permease
VAQDNFHVKIYAGYGGGILEDKRVGLWKSSGALIVLMVGSSVLYVLVYIRGTYYIPLMETLQCNNTQLGVMGAAYGLAAMLCYFPGGWLADRVSARKLLTISFVSTGLGGLYFATFPSFLECVLLHACWGIIISLTYWAAYVKAIRQMAAVTEQGRAFGFLEGGQGIVSGIILSLVLYLFIQLGSNKEALAVVINIYSVLCILTGIITWFVFKEKEDNITSGDLWGDVIRVIKMPKVWMIALIIFCAYAAMSATQFLVPYSSGVFGASVAFGAGLSIVKDYIRPFVAVGAGIAGDRIGSSKVIFFGYFLLFVGLISLVLVPGKGSMLPVLVINSVVIYLAMFMIRALYYALLEEGDIPVSISGAAVGFIATLGYIPEFLVPFIGGRLLDIFPGTEGFHCFFSIIALLVAVGFLATFYWMRITKEKRMAILELKHPTKS